MTMSTKGEDAHALQEMQAKTIFAHRQMDQKTEGETDG